MSGFPSHLQLTLGQIRYQTKVFARTPVAAFFTVVLPLMMLILFNALFGDGEVDLPSGRFSAQQFYTGGLAAFAAVSATYTNLANVVPILRDEGVLKRWRGTPLPPGVYIAGMVGMAVIVAVVGVVLMITISAVFYDVELQGDKIPAAAVTLVVGIAAFAALGLAVASLVPNARSAPAVANATILPLSFVSNIFIALEDPPRWLELIGDIFPLKPFVEAFQKTFSPTVEAPAFSWGSLAYVAAWGVAGAVIALRTFKWEPSAGGSTSRSRGRRREPADAVS